MSPLLAAGFTGLHVMQTRWFLRRKLQTHMRKATISSRYWSKLVKGVNSLEWRTCGLADLWYTTQFSASSALSPSDCGHVPALFVYSIQSDLFSASPISHLIKMLENCDVSFFDLCWVVVLFHPIPWETIRQIYNSFPNPLSLCLTLQSSCRNLRTFEFQHV